ncbi:MULTISPECIES: periplasmic heavy metal sensor [unclassified Siphonobacter]|uniref:periplasmic heavy metal sensor n=1 Tax=unclassified Siphonobacter TaxID=2635712 RepID=UPI000CB9C0CF|nr:MULTISPECIES: periplasmic heavy metal sensor [unclassified Siphonobacter]MDQ1087530.1 protein CpxP [Siphonobacter sp. SORGH_AS_1065]MDR6193683.1 protein CpxP [Siphonobacter sp. SORGH_AS_0500]PKK36553.1 hypothetical protein BWI96_11915 [Siphonobacter sp. SORGH_AS_0500]
MKKLIAFFVAGLLSTTLTFAQNDQGRSPEDRAQRQTEQLIKELNLSTEQAEKVKALSDDRMKQMQEMRANGARPDRQKMRELQENYEAKLKPVLTTEQWTKYEKIREEQRNRMRDRRPGGGN